MLVPVLLLLKLLVICIPFVKLGSWSVVSHLPSLHDIRPRFGRVHRLKMAYDKKIARGTYIRDRTHKMQAPRPISSPGFYFIFSRHLLHTIFPLSSLNPWYTVAPIEMYAKSGRVSKDSISIICTRIIGRWNRTRHNAFILLVLSKRVFIFAFILLGKMKENNWLPMVL